MCADFCYDSNGSAKHPASAIQRLKHRQGNSAGSLAGLWDGQPPNWPNLDRAHAILMMGTTSELQSALQHAENQGIQGIWVENDEMAIWYVRRKAGFSTKTVVSIAPLQRYWRLAANNPAQVPGQWFPLWDQQIYNDGISLADLRNKVLIGAQGITAWYED
jgi:hypothetical protein